jgi:hypothetical protein
MSLLARHTTLVPEDSTAPASLRPVPACLLSAFLLFPVSSCGPRNFENENDRLRARVMELERESEALRARASELESELTAAAAQPGSLPPEVRAAVPHLAGIAIDRLSHLRDTDADGRPDTLALYINAIDGRARPIQVTGTLRAHAAVLPGRHEAITLARAAFEPIAVREAYRASLMGFYYAFEVPLTPPDEPASAGQGQAMIVQVEFEDALTGREFTASREIPMHRP